MDYNMRAYRKTRKADKKVIVIPKKSSPPPKGNRGPKSPFKKNKFKGGPPKVF